MPKNTVILALVVLVAVLAGAGVLIWRGNPAGIVRSSPANYKNATYTIEGTPVTLANGRSEVATPPGSASKTVTTYFGNEAYGDFNGDGMQDVVFLLTQQTGGSGTFYYVAAALKTAGGFQGTNAVFLGDRIAPQTTEAHDGEIVVNYADRRPEEPMVAIPSVGVSKYFRLENGKLVEVVKNAGGAGENGSGIRGTVLLGPTCPVMRNPPDEACADKPYAAAFVVASPDGTRVIKEFSSDRTGKFSVDVPPGTYMIRSAPAVNILPRCASRDTVTVAAGRYTETAISCDTGIR